MVNLNKKNKKGSADFAKPTAKVGKAKAGAVNATNTAFTAKKLTLREQQLSTAQKVEALARGTGLARDSLAAQLKPTFGQTGHYNVNMRREAYGTLLKRVKESAEAGEVLGPLLEHASRGMVDEEASVRRVVLALTSWIFETHKAALDAFLDGWVQFLVLALLHLHEDIRKDAIRSLDVALKHHLPAASTGKILAALADSGATQRTRGKGPDPVASAFDLVDAYVRAKAAPTAAPPVCYRWEAVQRTSLRPAMLRRQPRGGSAALGDIPYEVYCRTAKWLGEQIVDDWLEAIPVLANRTQPTPMERAAHQRVVALVRRLWAFSAAAGYEAAAFTAHLPPAIRSHKALTYLITRACALVE